MCLQVLRRATVYVESDVTQQLCCIVGNVGGRFKKKKKESME